ncbi:MAG: hypothetical protein J6X28_04340 [Bacilli bacterium]|nr:hypothetical protein [Bacilli bacterium]
MEKIYEEKSLSQQKPKRISFSIVLSFVVALFAIVSLIAVGFNQISYAAPSETMTLHFGMFGTTPAAVLGQGDAGTIRVPMMFMDSDDADTATKPLFCIQQGEDPTDESGAYTSQGEKMVDFGLVYIMNKSRVLGGSGIVPSTVTKPNGSQLEPSELKYLETFATQIAVWMYMYIEYPAGSPYHGNLEAEHRLDIIHGPISVYSTKSAGNILYSGNLYDNYIAPVVDEARSATNRKTAVASLASKNISLVDDDTTYQTDKISVVANPASDLVNYSVDLSGLDGAYVVDKDGNRKSNLDTFAPGDYFYIRVPVNKVTGDSTKAKLTIVGEFRNYLGGEAYVATGAQSVVSVTYENYRIYNDSEVNFMVTPDTGMTTAQTIYFIGLIVLLCGVGIIYANAKPVEEK